jgi:hypothetical protein
MKLLILSFFAVILTYSLFFDEREDVSQSIQGIDSSVYIQKPDTLQVDCLECYYITPDSYIVR